VSLFCPSGNTLASFRGVSEASEPGMNNHDREYGFRACAKRRILRCAIAHRGMTMIVLKGSAHRAD